jgi:chromosome segregation ATPase
MRQRIEELQASLSERQRDLTAAEDSRHLLEDELEDANRQLDKIRSELEKAQVEADEALFSRREAETARDQLQDALVKLQEDSESHQANDLRDERLAADQRPIGLETGGRRWTAGLLGALLVLAALEGLSVWSGNGELISTLWRLANP